MTEKVCSKCGGAGPFPATGNQCKACVAARKALWYQRRKAGGWKQKSRPYQHVSGVTKSTHYRKNHHEQYKAYRRQLFERRYATDKDFREKHLARGNAFHRVRKWRTIMAKNEKLVEIIQQSIAESREQGLDEEDAKWMAVGAVNAEARAQGLVGDTLPPEFNAAAEALVKQELKK